MLFTRTIRRTMVCGLAMVLVMMIGLSLSALYSHLSYRHIISELEYAFNKIPRKAELVAAMAKLEAPLSTELPEELGVPPRPTLKRATPTPTVLRFNRANREDLQHLVAEALKETEDFLDKTQKLPPSTEFEQAKLNGLDVATKIHSQLTELEWILDHLDQLDDQANAYTKIKRIVDRVQTQATHAPDFPRGIPETLGDASTIFHRGFGLVVGSSAVAVLLFSGLILYGYIWVFSPLRKLHRGALRVAQGDFNYRLEFSRQDEMKEFADAFNSMTSRFQEIACDLDRQVCERSKQLIRSERLAGIGFLAAGVAHEINNPLSAIAMAAESLTDRLAETAEGPGQDSAAQEHAEITRQYLQMIQREAFRCQRITQKLLDFARGTDESRRQHDLTLIVNDVLGVVRHMSRYSDRTISFRRKTSCYAEINGPEIQQVVMNLVSNGLEAMECGGVMTIDITEQTDQVILTVSDDGCGMTAEVIENLFEPFFTQRRKGRGTGLGLSISHRIVGDHGGSIEVESPGPGHGSLFRVRLPRRTVKREAAA